MVLNKMENILTTKEQDLMDSNPHVLYLLEKLECEPRITEERILKSRINARVDFWMGEIIHPLNEDKITRK